MTNQAARVHKKKRLEAVRHVFYFVHKDTYYKLNPTTSPYRLRFIGRLRWWCPWAEEHVGMSEKEFQDFFPIICNCMGIGHTGNVLRLQRINSLKGKRFRTFQYLVSLPDSVSPSSVFMVKFTPDWQTGKQVAAE